MYALRDVTATVESIHLICSSIMSKKTAEGVKNLALNDYVKKGEAILEILYNSSKNIDEGVAIIMDSYTISKNENIKLIKEIYYEQRK